MRSFAIDSACRDALLTRDLRSLTGHPRRHTAFSAFAFAKARA